MLNDFIQFLVELQPEHDKMSHLFYGTILSIISIFTIKNPGVVIILLFSLAKEIHDYCNTTSVFELADVLYSVIPSLVFTYILKTYRSE